MTVLIDPPAWPAHGRSWSHLVSDVSFEELHAFARALGVPARGFEGDHYDVPQERYAAAVAAGADPVSGRELLRRLRAAGLRRPKRRGETVLASLAHGGEGGRLDTLRSRLPLPATPRAVLVALQRAGRSASRAGQPPGAVGELLVLPDGAGLALPRAVLGGVGALQRAGELVAAVLGQEWAGSGTLTQLGFLRFVPPGPGAADLELVLAWTPSRPFVGAAGGPPAVPPARWVSGPLTASALPVAVAPLLPLGR
jgi:Protein of unknown function (DUF4031)